MSFQISAPFICLFFAVSLFDGVKYPLMLIFAVGLHELGHILAASLVKAPCVSLRCGVQGLSLRFDFSALSHPREIFILTAGGLFGLLCAAAAYAFSPRLAYFSVVSVVLSLVNLLPVRGLDGGETLACVLDYFFLPDRAYRIEKVVSWVASLAFWVVALWIQLRVKVNLSLLAVALYFLWRSAAD